MLSNRTHTGGLLEEERERAKAGTEGGRDWSPGNKSGGREGVDMALLKGNVVYVHRRCS